MHSYGLNVVMIAHAIEERHGDDVKLRVDGQGEWEGRGLQVGRPDGSADINAPMSGDQRGTINWNPHVTGFGKNPAGLPTEMVPDVGREAGLSRQGGTDDSGLPAAEQASRARTRKCGSGNLREHFKTTLKTPEDFTARAKQMAEGQRPEERQGGACSAWPRKSSASSTRRRRAGS